MTEINLELFQNVRRIQIRTNRAVSDVFAGQYESVFKGRGMEFKEVREYVPGDDIRMIDWNVTARTSIPHVKLLAEERELTVMLMVDLSGSQRFGSAQRFKSELATELCAVIAFSAIQNNDKVGLICFTDDVELYIPPAKGRKHVLRLIRDLLFYSPKGDSTNIPVAMRFLNNVTRRRTVVFLVSDFFADDFETPLRIANKKHDIIGVVVSDPRESEIPAAGLVSVEDPETGYRCLIDTSDARVRDAYAQEAWKRQQIREERLKKARVDTIHVSTNRPYTTELYRFFRMREKRYA